jgi:uncharacterized protein (TIGR02302 family)
MSDADPRRSLELRRRVFLARAAAAFEAAWAALWPSLALIGVFLVVSLLGVWALLPGWLHGLALALLTGGLIWTLWRARASLRWPAPVAGLRRLERVNALSHQPLRSLGDRLSGGADDPATSSLWRRHQERLARALGQLRVGPPRSDLPRRDPWAFRAALLLLLLVALVEAGGMAPKRLLQAFELRRGASAAEVPVELTLWVTPPLYTGKPPVRLEAERPAPGAPVVVRSPGKIALPAGSEALAQLHHIRAPAPKYEIGLDKRTKPFVAIADESAEASLVIDRSGELRIGGADGPLGAWQIEAVPDQPPTIQFGEAPSATHRGVLRSQFKANDDYGIASIALLMSRAGHEDKVERIELMRPAGGTTKLDDAAYVDLTPHPWAGLPVVVRLEAVDGIDQRGRSEPQQLVLPSRPFQHPVARAIIEQRRRLAADPEQSKDVARSLDELSQQPATFQNDTAVFLALRSAVARLQDQKDPKALDDVLALLWDTALHLEDGSVSLAERDLRQLQQALKEALAKGASDKELERLMAELQHAMDEYLDALARQSQSEQADRQQQAQPPDSNTIQVERQDLQQMLDKIREMIKTGARDAAQQMLAQLQDLLENLQVAKNDQMQQGQQMMSQLQQMIQQQQKLLDQTFGMTRRSGQQEEQDQSGQEGEQQGQQGQQGQEQGDQGQQDQQGQMGQMQPGGRSGQQGQQGQMGQMRPGGQLGQMATDQDALRRALGELMRKIGEAGAQIPRSLGEAELAMRAARDALKAGTPDQAVDPQSRALDQLRQGGQAMMQEMQRMYGQGQGRIPGQQFGQAPNSRDPLGRSTYNQGGVDLWGEKVPTQLDLGKARSILEELQRRASDRQRPTEELDYLQRLLRRF